MTAIKTVDVDPQPLERFEGVLTRSGYERWKSRMCRSARSLRGRAVWNINSTPKGGGVVEMLHGILPYALGAGWDTRWVVIEGEDEFFEVTKRIHNALHGADYEGDLGPQERAVYDRVTERNVAALREVMQPGDIALIHDPQTAGLIRPFRQAGVHSAWQCHVGTDHPNKLTRRAWSFLMPYVAPSERYLFSRGTYLWECLDEERLRVVPPSIDPFAPKNQPLPDDIVEAILQRSGILAGTPQRQPVFQGSDGSAGSVRRVVRRIGDGPPPPADARIVAQVSRWDRLKDPVGIIRAFADCLNGGSSDVHVVYAGPDADGVADDPEADEVMRECHRVWSSLPRARRERIHLLALPMDDSDENAVIVNALQRRADVVVQKSLEEGFGLTTAEAMWKGRPVVGTRVGGIQDQIEHGRSGLLVDEPTDLAGLAEAVRSLLDDPELARRMGRAAVRRVRDQFLAVRQLMQYAALFEELASTGPEGPDGVPIP